MTNMENVEAAETGDIEFIRPFTYRENQKAELAALEGLVNEILKRQGKQDIGTMSLVRHARIADALSGPKFRSAPLPAYGGMEFWHATGSCDTNLPASVLISGLANEAEAFRANREAIARIGPEVRSLIDDAIGKFMFDKFAAPSAAMGVSFYCYTDKATIHVLVECLSDDLTIGCEAIRTSADKLDMLGEQLETVLDKHLRRAELREQYQANGLRGEIDETASCLLKAAGLGLSVAIDELGKQKHVRFTFGSSSHTGSLTWEDGVIKGSVFERGNVTYLAEGAFTFWQRLPETMRAALIGRPLTAVIERPYYPAGAIITAVHDFSTDGTRVDLKVPTLPLPTALIPW